MCQEGVASIGDAHGTPDASVCQEGAASVGGHASVCQQGVVSIGEAFQGTAVRTYNHTAKVAVGTARSARTRIGGQGSLCIGAAAQHVPDNRIIMHTASVQPMVKHGREK